MRHREGASIYDVRTEGGRGVPSKADIVSNLSKGGCVNLRTKKIRNFCRRPKWKPPYGNNHAISVKSLKKEQEMGLDFCVFSCRRRPPPAPIFASVSAPIVASGVKRGRQWLTRRDWLDFICWTDLQGKRTKGPLNVHSWTHNSKTRGTFPIDVLGHWKIVQS